MNIKTVLLVTFLLVTATLAGLAGNMFNSYAAGETASRHSGDTINVPSGTAPTLDGINSPNEWTDASQLNFNDSQGGSGTLYYKCDGTYFYALMDYTSVFFGELYFDTNHDAASTPQTDDIRIHASMAFYANYGTGTAWDTTNHPADNDWSGTTGAVTTREFKVSYSKLGITAGTPKTIGVMFHFMVNPDSPKWPSNSSQYNPSTWGDMSSSANWGTGGPGNFKPMLSGGIVSPTSEFTTTEFTFNVTYRDLDNDAPSVKQIVIDDTEYDLTSTDSTYTDGSNFEYTTYLSAGDHNFYFKFNDTKINVRLPLAGVFDGPSVILPNSPPDPVGTGIPNGTLGFDEDSTDGGIHLIDLEQYFTDDRDDGALRFEMVYKEDESKLDATVDGQFLNFEQMVEHWFGTMLFSVRVKDLGLDGAVGGDTDLVNESKIFSVTVNPVVDAPVITKVENIVVNSENIEFSDSSAAVEDEWFNFTIQAKDPDVDMGAEEVFTFDINNSLITIEQDGENPLLAHASFLPENKDVGTIYAKITVKDDTGSDTDDYVNLTIEVKNANDDPIIVAVNKFGVDYDIVDKTVEFKGSSSAFEETYFNITVTASDADIDIGEDDKITFATNNTLDNFHLDSTTGEISFLPTQEDVGKLYVKVTIMDSYDLMFDDFVNLIIDVRNVNDPPSNPEIRSETGIFTFKDDGFVNLTAEGDDPDIGYDPDEKLTYIWESDVDGNLGSGGTLSTDSLTPGMHNITLTVTDFYGSSKTQVISLNVLKSDVIDDDPKDDDKKDGGSDSKSVEKGGNNNMWIILVIVVVVVAILAFFMVMNKKKKGKAEEQMPEQMPMMNGQQYPVPGDMQAYGYPADPAAAAAPFQTSEQLPQYNQQQYPGPVGVQVQQQVTGYEQHQIPQVTDQPQPQFQAQPPQLPLPQPAAMPPQAAVPQQQQPQLCTTCSQPLSYVAETNSYYCYQCQQYA